MGNPTEETWPGVTSFKDFAVQFPRWEPVNLCTVIPNAKAPALDFIVRCLAMVPSKRMITYRAIQHPWFDGVDSTNKTMDLGTWDPIEKGEFSALPSNLRKFKRLRADGTSEASSRELQATKSISQKVKLWVENMDSEQRSKMIAVAQSYAHHKDNDTRPQHITMDLATKFGITIQQAHDFKTWCTFRGYITANGNATKVVEHQERVVQTKSLSRVQMWIDCLNPSQKTAMMALVGNADEIYDDKVSRKTSVRRDLVAKFGVTLQQAHDFYAWCINGGAEKMMKRRVVTCNSLI